MTKLIKIKMIVHEGDNVVVECYKFVKQPARHVDYVRLVEHEAALAHYYRRMRKDPLLCVPDVIKEEKEGEIIVNGYY